MAIRTMSGTQMLRYEFQFANQTYSGPTGHKVEAKAKEVEQKARVLAREGHAPDAVKAIIAAGAGAVIPAPAKAVASGQMLLVNAIASYLQTREDRLPVRSEATKKVWKLYDEEEAAFNEMVDLFGDDALIGDIDEAMVLKAVKAKRAKRNAVSGEPLSGSYVNRMSWKLLQRVHNHARNDLKLTVQTIDWQAKGVQQKEADPITREITPAMMDAIEHAKDSFGRSLWRDGYRDVVELGVLTGFRVDDLVTLTWSQIDFDNRVISVVQKLGRNHTIQIDDETLAVLLRLKKVAPKGTAQIFTYVAMRTGKNGKTGAKTEAGVRYPITEAGFRSWLNTIAKACGLKITPHDMRRTCATIILRATGNLVAASQRLGHSGTEITGRLYAHVKPDDQVEIMNTASGSFRQKVAAAKARKLDDEKTA